MNPTKQFDEIPGHALNDGAPLAPHGDLSKRILFTRAGGATTSRHMLVREMIKAMGDDPDRAGLKDTPARVISAWAELFAGYRVKVEALFTVFEEPHEEMVVVKGIQFASTCEHHLLPFTGVAHVGYVPGTGPALSPQTQPHHRLVVGLSKLARVVDAFARRLTIQERITRDVVEALVTFLGPAGCGCVIEATHGCMSCRGVRQPNAVTVTSELRGVFRTDDKARAEFLNLVHGGNR